MAIQNLKACSSFPQQAYKAFQETFHYKVMWLCENISVLHVPKLEFEKLIFQCNAPSNRLIVLERAQYINKINYYYHFRFSVNISEMKCSRSCFIVYIYIYIGLNQSNGSENQRFTFNVAFLHNNNIHTTIFME